MNWLANKIATLLAERCLRNNRVFYITGGANKETTYLVRYIVFKSKYLCVYIHRFMRSDADDPHDHPWNFLTYIIKGTYKEEFFNKRRPVKQPTYFESLWTKELNTRTQGSLAFRRATDIHRVVIDRNYEMSEIEQAPFTLCVIGPRIREWGFWPASGKFIDWRTYLNIDPNDPALEGSE